MSKWLRQALSDLEAARDSLNANHHEWSCFQAQQAGEKAVKAFLYSRGYTSMKDTKSTKEAKDEALDPAPKLGDICTVHYSVRQLIKFHSSCPSCSSW